MATERRRRRCRAAGDAGTGTRVLGLLARALPPRLDVGAWSVRQGPAPAPRPRSGPFASVSQRSAPRGDAPRARAARRRIRSGGERSSGRRRSRVEYRAKLDDLARQYATRVTVEWVQTLELAMPVHRFTVQIRRRKADRVICWTGTRWRGCWSRRHANSPRRPSGPRLVCDDALHLVVPAGLAPCASCGRAFCRACHPERCPKCGAGSGPTHHRAEAGGWYSARS